MDLARWAGQRVKLSLTLAASEPGILGFWGAPVIRSRSATPRSPRPQPAAARRDPDSGRHAAPRSSRRLRLRARDRAGPQAAGGGRRRCFNNYTAQATWTKVSTPSLMTSLYPLVARRGRTSPTTCPRPPIRWPNRSAPPATRRSRSSSVLFTGQFTNLHQGFEELHEDGSVTAPRLEQDRARVRRSAQAWLEAHPTRRSSPSCTSSIRTIRTSRTGRTTRLWADPGAQGRARAPAEGGPQGHQGSAAAAVRHAVARRAEEGRLRSRSLRAARQGLVRRLDPRHGRRDRPPAADAAAARPGRARRWSCS